MSGSRSQRLHASHHRAHNSRQNRKVPVCHQLQLGVDAAVVSPMDLSDISPLHIRRRPANGGPADHRTRHADPEPVQGPPVLSLAAGGRPLPLPAGLRRVPGPAALGWDVPAGRQRSRLAHRRDRGRLPAAAPGGRRLPGPQIAREAPPDLPLDGPAPRPRAACRPSTCPPTPPSSRPAPAATPKARRGCRSARAHPGRVLTKTALHQVWSVTVEPPHAADAGAASGPLAVRERGSEASEAADSRPPSLRSFWLGAWVSNRPTVAAQSC